MPKKSKRSSKAAAAAAATRAAPPKNKTQLALLFKKRCFSEPIDLVLLDACNRALQNGGKKNLWLRLKRDPRINYLITLISKHKDHYNKLVKEHNSGGPLLFLRTIVPLMKYQRTASLPLDHLPLTLSTAMNPPLYGARLGCADSDIELDEPEPPVSRRTAKATAVVASTPDSPLTIEEKLEKRTQESTITALKFKLLSMEYQSTLMRARYDFVNAQKAQGATTIIQPDPIDIPPLNGVSYITFPFHIPNSIIKYLKSHPSVDQYNIKELKLITPNTFLPTIQDEYRYIYNEMQFYYRNREQPLTLNYEADLYLTPDQYVEIQSRVSKSSGNFEAMHDDDDSDSDESRGASRRNPQPKGSNANIRFSTPLSSFKTFLNNILGVPQWYTVVVANFMFKLQSFFTDPQTEMPPPLVIEQLHAYQRNIFVYLVQNHFAQYRTTVTQNPANPKDHYVAQFFGGGRHYQNVSSFYPHTSEQEQRHSENVMTND